MPCLLKTDQIDKSTGMKKKDLKTYMDRSAGILLHISSLPGDFGIGQIGQEAHNFLSFLKEAGQTYWQFLPLGPISPAYGNSPYMSPSALAGNPLFIDINGLIRGGLLKKNEIPEPPAFSEYSVDYPQVSTYQLRLLKMAFNKARNSKLWQTEGWAEQVENLLQENGWVHDYALFMALKEKFQEKAWYEWPEKIAAREDRAMAQVQEELREEILFHLFCQVVFNIQWQELREKATGLGIRLFGDMPIYVSPDSADVWANQEAFDLHPKTRQPRFIAGVPPDYFSKTGQRWGNPLYRWKVSGRPNKALYHWWTDRFKRLKQLVDAVRIDHFRGFESYWKIPASEETAINGKWVKGPGKQFFKAMQPAIEEIEIIAEDLGTITPEVQSLREGLGFPGMKVLLFAFDSDSKNLYLPHNFENSNFVVYTGTHDNSTAVGWFMDPTVSQWAKDRAKRYANSDGSRIHWDLIRLAYSSVARIAMVPMQDVLGFGDDCRMNTPSMRDGNWRWRLSRRFLTLEVAGALLSEADFYNRIPKTSLDN